MNFPTIITPQKNKLFQKMNNYFLNFIIEQDIKAKEVKLFKKIILEVDSFVVRIEE